MVLSDFNLAGNRALIMFVKNLVQFSRQQSRNAAQSVGIAAAISGGTALFATLENEKEGKILRQMASYYKESDIRWPGPMNSVRVKRYEDRYRNIVKFGDILGTSMGTLIFLASAFPNPISTNASSVMRAPVPKVFQLAAYFLFISGIAARKLHENDKVRSSATMKLR